MKIASIFSRVERYIGENLGIPFILFFQALLLSCVFLPFGGNIALAEEIAVYAFTTLVVGVILQFFSYLVYGKERPRVDRGFVVEGPVVARRMEGSEDSTSSVVAPSLRRYETRDIYPFEPRVSVVIPALNEETRITNTLMNWIQFLSMHDSTRYELLVIMDGCTDKTVDVVSELAESYHTIIPLKYPKRLGKGGALIEAFNQSRGEMLFFSDADGSMSLDEFLKFIKLIKTYDLVIGCRYFRGSDFLATLPLRRLIFSRVFNVLIRTIFPELVSITDTQCGAKALRKQLIDVIGDDLFITDFAFDVNLIYSTLRNGFSIKEVAVNCNHVETDSKVSHNLLHTSFVMTLSIIRLKLYYSKLRDLLYSNRVKGGINFLLRAVK